MFCFVLIIMQWSERSNCLCLCYWMLNCQRFTIIHLYYPHHSISMLEMIAIISHYPQHNHDIVTQLQFHCIIAIHLHHCHQIHLNYRHSSTLTSALLLSLVDTHVGIVIVTPHHSIQYWYRHSLTFLNESPSSTLLMLLIVTHFTNMTAAHLRHSLHSYNIHSSPLILTLLLSVVVTTVTHLIIITTTCSYELHRYHYPVFINIRVSRFLIVIATFRHKLTHLFYRHSLHSCHYCHLVAHLNIAIHRHSL